MVCEWILTAAAKAQGLDAISLRYFNVAGSGSPDLGDVMALNLVPMVLERLDAHLPPRIFGDDYDTPDGTCVRDYVHVTDVAEAHIVALEHLDPQRTRHRIFNLGTGKGTSVREMIDEILDVSGAPRSIQVVSRRSGDPASIVGAVERIGSELNWQSRFGLRDIVESAWIAHEFMHLEG